jgi:hypothetical protein
MNELKKSRDELHEYFFQLILLRSMKAYLIIL